MDTTAIDAAGQNHSSRNWRGFEESIIWRISKRRRSCCTAKAWPALSLQLNQDARKHASDRGRSSRRLGLPERNTTEGRRPIETASRGLHAACRKMFELLGDPADKSASGSGTILKVRNSPGDASMKNTDCAIRTRLSQDDAGGPENAHAEFSWEAYSRPRDIGIEEINVGSRTFLGPDAQLTAIPIDDWKTYLRWQL